jgi:hypothetical protein
MMKLMRSKNRVVPRVQAKCHIRTAQIAICPFVQPADPYQRYDKKSPDYCRNLKWAISLQD